MICSELTSLPAPTSNAGDILFLEYQYLRIYSNSVGMQAACERAYHKADSNSSVFETNLEIERSSEHFYIQEVVSGCCESLARIVQLARNGNLRFAPIRIFHRLTTSSVFLLKALSIGVRNDQLGEAFEILDKTVEALDSTVLDDVHLGGSYAKLLKSHVDLLRQRLSETSTRGQVGRPDSRRVLTDMMPEVFSANNAEFADASGTDALNARTIPQVSLSAQDYIDGTNWLSLPFDPSMAPFGQFDTTNPGFMESNDLNFLWKDIPDLPAFTQES